MDMLSLRFLLDDQVDVSSHQLDVVSGLKFRAEKIKIYVLSAQRCYLKPQERMRSLEK